MQFDINEMTLGEVEEFEELSGCAITDVASGKMPVKALTVMVYLQLRRDDPAATMEDARKIKLVDLNLDGSGPPPQGGAS